MGKRLSITLTDTQAEALDALAQESGATLQSMIGLAVSAWLRDQRPQAAPEPQGDGPELLMRMMRDGQQVQQVRARWADRERGTIVATARRHGTGDPWREYDGPQMMTLKDGITVESMDPWDVVDDALWADERRDPSGWYGWASITVTDPLSGETMHEGIGYDGPFATIQQAQEHAERIAAANREDGTPAVAVVEMLDSLGTSVTTHRFVSEQ